jgi:cysteine desulfurase
MINKNSPQKYYYFDWASTSLPDVPLSFEAPFGNPSSMHREGRRAKDALEDARSRCAAVLGVKSDTLYFTSGGTEANCIPLFSQKWRPSNGRIIASAGEHSSVRENIKTLEKMGRPVGIIPIDSLGRVTCASLLKTLDKYSDARFAAIMAVNNETGTVNDIAALSGALKQRGGPPIHLHCDMVQAAGKIALDISGWAVDSASISAHKIGGPRGIGLLYLRKPLEALQSGGGQERGIRPGTENVAGALALASCLENHARPEKALAELALAKKRCQGLLDTLKSNGRFRLIPEGREHNENDFSPYIIQAAFKDIPGEVMARALDDIGFAVSTGAACSSARPERPVLAAMGLEDSLNLEGIRISQGFSTTEEEIGLLAEAIFEVLNFL